jgi:hypothetical protein
MSPFDGWAGLRETDGTQALHTGLELARASQLTMLRLQLALHRSNRRTAMQALDHLLDIDAEMEGLAATLGGPAHLTKDAALSGFIGFQKAAIAAEKHALTGSDWRDDAGAISISAPSNWANDTESPAQMPYSYEEAARHDRTGSARRLIVIGVALLAIGIGIGLAVYLSPTLPTALMSFLDF